MKIRVIDSSDSLFWYTKYINKVFDVVREEKDRYWTYEPSDRFRLINWILKTDCEIVKE